MARADENPPNWEGVDIENFNTYLPRILPVLLQLPFPNSKTLVAATQNVSNIYFAPRFTQHFALLRHDSFAIVIGFPDVVWGQGTEWL